MRVGLGYTANTTPIYAPGSPQAIALNCPSTCAGVVGYNPCCSNNDVVGVAVPGTTQITQAQADAFAAQQNAAAAIEAAGQQVMLQLQQPHIFTNSDPVLPEPAGVYGAVPAAATTSAPVQQPQYVPNSTLPGQTQASLFSQLGLPMSTGSGMYTTALDGNVYQDVGISSAAPFGWVACPQCVSEYQGVAGNASTSSTSLSSLLPWLLVGGAAWILMGGKS